jgi:hypothetical protein
MQIKPHTDCIHRTARVGDGTPPEEVPGHSHFALRDWEIRSLRPGPGFTLTGVGSGTGVHASVGHSLIRLVATSEAKATHLAGVSAPTPLPRGGVSVVNEASAEYHRQSSQYLLITLVPMPFTHGHAILLKLGFYSARLLFFYYALFFRPFVDWTPTRLMIRPTIVVPILQALNHAQTSRQLGSC